MDALPAIVWSDEARRELPVRARSRRLVIDYFAARCCGRNVSVGDLHVRWSPPSQPIADEFVPLATPMALEAYVQRDLIPVLEAARGRIVMHGWGRLRRPVVELAEGAVWLDFIAACRARSPLSH
ncbi:MAG TPA: hypothetical protein VET90_04425 [Candidatus Binatus sp.]|nr:hypothetical protein [Candidatus Binatus sp.]